MGKILFFDPAEHRIRSFVTRAGRLSTTQERTIMAHAHFFIPFSKAHLDFEKAFGCSAPTVLEIGFGIGETSAHIAIVHIQEKKHVDTRLKKHARF